jgi:ABC-type multidrug transport system fused ATPase/permease subunit
VIAHRFSTIRRADCIFVVKDGAIVESGRHEELLRKNGLYAELSELQLNREQQVTGQ